MGFILSGANPSCRAADQAPATGQRPPSLPDGGALMRRPEDIPAVSGAYVLVVALTRPLTITICGATRTLGAGRYLYCGSAYGPGGLRARIARHLRSAKPIRWHIDRLTTCGKVRGAWIFPDGEECTLARSLAHLPAPVPGFGSSDCPNCRSHLFHWRHGVGLRRE